MPPPLDTLSVASARRLTLAEVTSVADPDDLGRVEIRPWNLQGFPEQTLKAWARVAVPFAGPDSGAFLLPDVGDEVLVGFVDGDPREPVVIGSFWNARQRPPERLGGGRKHVDRWTLRTRSGTRIAIVEEGSPQISLTTPAGVTVELDDQNGGQLTCRAQGSTIRIDSAGVSVRTGSTVSVNAGQVEVTAGSVTVNTGTATFSGLVQCNTLVATTVMATTYTPGAGNIW
jgi:uncharacterized protein involved in type VI secretion and phage assembly